MKIVADEKIPLLKELFSKDHLLVLKPGDLINHADLIDAQVLLVRSITKVNAHLLTNTSVKFVGSATAGINHLDINWLNQAKINWGYAAGANARAVVDYVLCCIAALHQQNFFNSKQLRAGVIGLGHIGNLVNRLLKKLGFQTLHNDPPRAAQDANFSSVPLKEFQNLDLICVHPSLTTTGEFPSFHLLEESFLNQQKSGCVILNASRGEIIDSNALLSQHHLHLCLDVWEKEPNINLSLLKKVLIGTPHIAGYSIQAQQNAILLLYQEMQKLFNLNDTPPFLFSHATDSFIQLTTLKECGEWEKEVLKQYNPLTHTKLMKELILPSDQPAVTFKKLRYDYPLRNHFIYSTENS